MPFRLRKEWIYLFALVAIAAGAFAFYYVFRPDGLRVAYPREGGDAKVIEAFAAALREQHKNVRLTLVPVEGYTAAAAAMERREVQLAVVRPDVAMPVNGLTVAILREEAVILLMPGAAKVESVEKLRGKRLGVVSSHEADLRFVASLLDYYKLAPPALTIVPLRMEEVETALREKRTDTEKRVDAVAVIAPPGGPQASAVLEMVERVAPRAAPKGKAKDAAKGATEGGAEPSVQAIPIAESEALADRLPTLSAIKIPVGGLGGRPKVPAEELNTVGVSSRLVARSDLDAGPVSNFTQYLFELRPRLAAATPAANRIKAPDTTMGLVLPTHPGAIRYIEREQLTFFEQYGDYIYLALFCGGGVSSALAWVSQRLLRRRRELVDEVLDRLTCILTEAREATSIEALNELAGEVDGLVTHALRYTRHRGSNAGTMNTLMLAIDAARAAISDRRRDLLDEAARAEQMARRGIREEPGPREVRRSAATPV